MKKTLLTFIILLHISVAIFSQKPLVVATASMISDMASNIAGETLEIECIVPIGGDPHLHEPTPRDARLVAEADLILKNGLTFEGWLNKLIENSGSSSPVVTVTDGLTPISSQEYENSSDPHAWMDVQKALTYIGNIKNAFVELDPEHAEDYNRNHSEYRAKLESLDEYIIKSIQSIPENRRILITSHDAFQYYGRRYGVRLEAILGTSTDAEVQTSDFIRINNVIKQNKVPAVFIESTINPKLLKQLAKDNDIEVGGELYADSIGDEESPAASYVDMMRHNTDVIVKALSREVSVAAKSGAETEKSMEDGPGGWFPIVIGIVLALLGLILTFIFSTMKKKA